MRSQGRGGAVARNNEMLATRKTDQTGPVLVSRAGLARREAVCLPDLTASGENTDYASLSLNSNALTLGPRVSRPGRARGADAFVYAELALSLEPRPSTSQPAARRAGQRP